MPAVRSSGGQVLLVLLAGSLLVNAGVGEAGPDGQVQVEPVAEPGRDDGLGGDRGVEKEGQDAVAAGQHGTAGHRLAVGTGEREGTGGRGGDQPAAGVHDDVVGFAQRDQVPQPGLPAVGPGDDVVDVGAPGPAAREPAAALVAFADGAAQRGGGTAVPAADVEQGAVVVVQHPGHRRVAGQGPGGRRGE